MQNIKSKIFIFLVYLSILVTGYGCTTAQDSINPANETRELEKVIFLQQKVDRLEAEITKLRVRQLELEGVQKHSAKEKQHMLAKIERLEQRIDYLEKRKLNIEQEKYQAEIKKLNKRQSRLMNEISALNSSISDIYADTVSSDSEDKSVKAMADEIRLSVSQLKRELDQIEQEKAQLKKEIDKSHAQIAALKVNSASDGSNADQGKSESPLSLDLSEEKNPEIVEVFYGTNRAKLVSTWGDVFKPLLLPIVLLLAFFVFPFIVRLILKDHLQGPSIMFLKSIIGVAFLLLSVLGIQSSVQQWQVKRAALIQYGPDRMKYNESLPFELGICQVSIPPTHKAGVVEVPKLMRLELTVNPDKHFMMAETMPKKPDAFYKELAARVAASDDKDMFVFVHGFHNTFENAAFRTAQIAYDLNFSGAPVFFSWPSQGRVVDYPTDESNAGAAVQDLRIFLTNLIENSQAQKIHLIAHSMGNRVLTRAVKGMNLPSNNTPLFSEVILAAPDMDAKTFKDIVPDMAKRANRVTLYASSKDKALVASNFIHGEYQRAGESNPMPVVVNPIESIDVSRVTDGHSYIADDGHILNDLNNILKHSRVLSKEIAEQKLIGLDNDETYWVLRLSL